MKAIPLINFRTIMLVLGVVLIYMAFTMNVCAPCDWWNIFCHLFFTPMCAFFSGTIKLITIGVGVFLIYMGIKK